MKKKQLLLTSRLVGKLVRLWLTALVSTLFSMACHAAMTNPTVKELVEFPHIVQPANHDNIELQYQISPDRRLAFIVTRRADVALGRNRFEIMLFDLDRSRLETATNRASEILLTVDAQADVAYQDTPIQDAQWMGNLIVLRARFNDGLFQVYTLEIETRKLTQLTFAEMSVTNFDVSSDFKRVVYAVRLDNPAVPIGAQQLVIANHQYWDVLFGQSNPLFQRPRFQYYFEDRTTGAKPKALGEPFSDRYLRKISVSPDGEWAIVRIPEPNGEQQLKWAKHYPKIALTFERYMFADADPLRYFSRANAVSVLRRVLFRLPDGTGQFIFDAPDDSTSALWTRVDQIWQSSVGPDGPSVVIAGTFLPITSDRKAVADTGSHIIEYWPQSRKWISIASLNGDLWAGNAVSEHASGFMVLDGGKSRRFLRQAAAPWREVPDAPPPADLTNWTLRIDQALNQAPNLVAIGPLQQSVRLTNLSPQFNPAEWGWVQPYTWKDREGRQWGGGLIAPNGVNFDSNSQRPKKYSLVIQTYGFDAAKFYLDGPNTHMGYTSAFAGRAFAREGILVLAMPWRPLNEGPATSERKSIERYGDGVIGAIDALVAQGIVERERIGVIGFSATGDFINYLLTFRDTPIRAATIADGVSSSLFSVITTYGFSLGNLQLKLSANDAKPFGNKVDIWAKNDPSLNTHCVSAAIRIESYDTLIKSHWDTYALLRMQYKAVEMIMMPKAGHSLGRPGHRMLSLQGNVDWFNFWLNGKERTDVIAGMPDETDATLEEQYVRWRQMAELKVIDDMKPRCPPNRW